MGQKIHLQWGVCVYDMHIYIYVGMCAQASREHQMSSYITFHFIPLRKGH